MPLVRPTGFADSRDPVYASPDSLDGSNDALPSVSIPNDTDPETLRPHFDRISLLAIEFPSVFDGRGFSLARRLRRLGYGGELRARGHVIADQFAHALACGFDAVEIDDALAARQPEEQWLAVERRVLPPYRAKRVG